MGEWGGVGERLVGWVGGVGSWGVAYLGVWVKLVLDSGPNLAEFGPNSVELRPNSADSRANVGRARSNFPISGPKFGRIRARSG